ncbi:hypothetical protein [Alicyclobacillus sp. SO9]|uniref:lysine 5,6-aminomutase reactivase subunit KamB n=1 Tax=Alicyclobacillus sp. SO9 TaxID=2665646 RepID=UPI0018E89FB2|nr:hypothetical protein [Alicyclobacillus sp. SO9]QQE78874.1 hypothetical protein GI364_24065 [Alicyclobacillus sp. SO9]
MDWIAQCKAKAWNRIAFIGASKHAGKTTAMNAFISTAISDDMTLGLCSIGLDGERLDTILGVEKPPVYAPVGTLVASAEAALEASEAVFEYIEDTGISSPLGNILIARTETSGHVVLAGVRQRRHIQTVVPMLQALGAEICLVDGAFSRVAAATPDLVDAVVLSVGAVLGTSADRVAAAARPFLLRFQLPEVTMSIRKRLQAVVEAGDIGIWTGSEVVKFPRHQGVLGLSSHHSWPTQVKALWLPGAVTDEVLQGLRSQPRGIELVAAHPAQVTAGREALQRWFRNGHRLSVWRQVPVAAITVNPHSITGYDLSSETLVAAIAELAPGIPVLNARATAATVNRGTVSRGGVL